MDNRSYWTTSALAPGRQFTHWRELICEAFLALTPESDLRDGFAGSVTQWRLGALSLARIESQRQTVHRTEAGVARDPIGGYYANLQLRGTSLMAQHGRVATLRPGDLAVVDADEPFRFEFGGDFRQLSLFVPAASMTTSEPVRTATAIDTVAGVGAAVRHSLESLAREPLREATAARLALHAAGMLSIALEPSILTPVRSPRSYHTCIQDIEEHLTDEDLSPAATARRLGISVRTVHGLFAGHEASYAATVRRLRLERAARHLTDPAMRHLRVIDVATEAGFGNVASFHRAFRKQFGRTPNAGRG
ncbi:helix-turn-helix domain-containing protein [Dactylosporangium sp. NPDC005555]|uniref:AraC-like ligand-binding domain-containing protein n=1 Tax=Dactylosporangium sp. NPDC005555 TaxID=3154889 RepID=UPI0033AFE1A5